MENPDWVKAVFDLEDLELRFGFAVDALQLMADGLGAVYEEQACNAVDTMARLLTACTERWRHWCRACWWSKEPVEIESTSPGHPRRGNFFAESKVKKNRQNTIQKFCE